jgi:hypothetical protein
MHVDNIIYRKYDHVFVEDLRRCNANSELVNKSPNYYVTPKQVQQTSLQTVISQQHYCVVLLCRALYMCTVRLEHIIFSQDVNFA